MVLMHNDDARAIGVVSGDLVRLVSPAGSREALVTVSDTIMPGVIGVEHGFGHTALGARDVIVDGQRIQASPGANAGINLNDLVPNDPSRQGVSTLTECDTGSAVRQGIPVRVEKI
jgi:tetrathionate reductase subunit A